MKILVWIFVVLSLGVLPGCGEGEERFGRREEGWGFEAEDYDAGRILLEPYGSLFYALIRSRRDPSNDPLVIWLNGGPGSSSMFGLLMENGPWKLVNDGDLERNEYSWNNIANMLYVDQPFGTGFSTVSSSEYLVKNENEAAVYFHRFLVSFIEKFPEYKHRPLYLTGESYAGRYIPAISNEIIKQNYSTINLVGWAIGNGNFDPIVQIPELSVYTLENDLITKDQADKTLIEHLERLKLNRGDRIRWYENYFRQVWDLVFSHRALNGYDIRTSSTKWNVQELTKFFNNESIQKRLNVHQSEWVLVSQMVYSQFDMFDTTKISSNVEIGLSKGIRYFIFAGDKDLNCNWRGIEAWSNSIGFDCQDTFTSSRYQKWNVDGEEAGEFKHHDDFTFLRVFEAGHMVPMDQPKRSLAMLQSFIKNDFKDII